MMRYDFYCRVCQSEHSGPGLRWPKYRLRFWHVGTTVTLQDGGLDELQRVCKQKRVAAVVATRAVLLGHLKAKG